VFEWCGVRAETYPPADLVRPVFDDAGDDGPCNPEDICALRGGDFPHGLIRFRSAHRTSVGAYLRGLRVAFACRELARSRDSLASIAAAAGFYDQAHMTRVVGRATGATPAAIRAMAARRRT